MEEDLISHYSILQNHVHNQHAIATAAISKGLAILQKEFEVHDPEMLALLSQQAQHQYSQQSYALNNHAAHYASSMYRQMDSVTSSQEAVPLRGAGNGEGDSRAAPR